MTISSSTPTNLPIYDVVRINRLKAWMDVIRKNGERLQGFVQGSQKFKYQKGMRDS